VYENGEKRHLPAKCNDCDVCDALAVVGAVAFSAPTDEYKFNQLNCKADSALQYKVESSAH
jgi:MinD superfamily P-loop ATPase